jgi:hypothetical protein
MTTRFGAGLRFSPAALSAINRASDGVTLRFWAVLHAPARRALRCRGSTGDAKLLTLWSACWRIAGGGTRRAERKCFARRSVHEIAEEFQTSEKLSSRGWPVRRKLKDIILSELKNESPE